jgi:Skp family chaperone for outer membrane proteins
MKTLLVTAALAASMLTPAAANAQAIPGAVIAVVDLDRVTAECTACKSAAAALRGQVSSLQARAKTLGTPLETEGKSIQTAIEALNGKDADAALKARVNAFEQKRQSAEAEIARGQQQVQRNQAYVSQQIQSKLGPIYQQVMQKRGANVMVEVGNTLATASALDVTNDVLAAINAQLPSVNTTAPAAPQQQQQQPQGR